jgi:hypothetical protein
VDLGGAEDLLLFLGRVRDRRRGGRQRVIVKLAVDDTRIAGFSHGRGSWPAPRQPFLVLGAQGLVGASKRGEFAAGGIS